VGRIHSRTKREIDDVCGRNDALRQSGEEGNGTEEPGGESIVEALKNTS